MCLIVFFLHAAKEAMSQKYVHEGIRTGHLMEAFTTAPQV
jgi:hypothetical protein